MSEPFPGVNGSSKSLAQTLATLERGRAEGLHLGAQLYVWRSGQVLADVALGEARPGVPLDLDTLMLWLSSGKPLTAIAIARLWEQGRLGLDDPVSQHIPEFAAHGKDRITVRHLLTHSGGFRTAEKCDLGRQWSEIIACIAQTPPERNWIPGRRAGYHTSASWYILGELVRRLDGRSLERYVQDDVFAPCGMTDCWLALDGALFQQYGDHVGLIYHTEKGAPVPHRRWNRADDAAVCRPGRSARGPVRQLGQFYRILLQLWQGAITGQPLVNPTTVREFTKRHRIGLFDDTFQHVMDWGLGFAADSKRYGRDTVPYNYGRYCSEDAFGHSGAQSSCAFADPAHNLVVAWACNGMPGERLHQRRASELNSTIYQDLGLAD